MEHRIAVCPTCKRVVKRLEGEEEWIHEHALVFLKLVELEGVRLTRVENEELWSRLRWLPKLVAAAARCWEADRVEPADVEELLDLYLSVGLFNGEHYEAAGLQSLAVRVAIAVTAYYLASDIAELKRRRQRGLFLVEVADPTLTAAVAWELFTKLRARNLRVRDSFRGGVDGKVVILHGAGGLPLKRVLARLERGSGFAAVVLVMPLPEATALKERAARELARWLRGIEVV